MEYATIYGNTNDQIAHRSKEQRAPKASKRGKGGIEMKKGNYMETITRKCECGATVEVDARLIGMIDEESFPCDKCNKEMKHKLDEKKQAEENGEQVFI